MLSPYLFARYQSFFGRISIKAGLWVCKKGKRK
jgi:hypothetical protein